MFPLTCLFFKLHAHAQGAKVMALSSVVTGKEVESDAIALHRELECEYLSLYLSIYLLFFTPLTLCLALLFLLNVQIEMSSAETENKH